MLRIAICDDERDCLDEIRGMTENWCAFSSFQAQIDCFDNGDALIKASSAARYDIVFWTLSCRF